MPGRFWGKATAAFGTLVVTAFFILAAMVGCLVLSLVILRLLPS